MLGNLYATVEEDAPLHTVAAAFESGIRLFDTALLYGHGLSEHRISTALRRYPRDAFLLAGRYTLLEQGGLDSFLPRCVAENVSIILGAPFNFGYPGDQAIPDAATTSCRRRSRC